VLSVVELGTSAFRGDTEATELRKIRRDIV